MLIMPIWAWIIFFIIGGIVYLVMLPKRKRDSRSVTETSGKINEVEELQYFLNELERNLRRLDPQAEISLTDRNR